MTKKEVGYILAKLEELHADVKEIRDDGKGKETRLKSLETSRAYFKGAGLVVTFIFGSAMRYLYNLLGE